MTRGTLAGRIVLGLSVAPFMRAQAPAFEVTSVRPLNAGERVSTIVSCSPSGRFVSGGPLRQILFWAYNIKPFQLVGDPDWDPKMMVDNKGLYGIEAKASGPVTEDVCKLMVQALLAERFKMVAHREQMETSVFALMVGKNGLKTQKASESDTASGINVIINGNPLGVAVGASKDGRPRGWSMEFLADFLGIAQLGRPIVDRTGLEGLYKINLNFSISYPANPNYEPPPGAGPDIRTALQEQMGLRLESTKAPIEMVVIDHIEKPDAN
jgi:uncharacterized protein (TIGR03435 family)